MSRAQALGLGLDHPEAESIVLGTMVSDLGFGVSLLDKLTPDCFTVPQNKLVFESIANLIHGIEPIDAVAIANMANALAKRNNLKMIVSREYVQNLTANFFQASGYVSTLKSYRDLRAFADFSFWFIDKVQEKPEIEALYAEAQEKLKGLLPKANGTGFVYGWETGDFHEASFTERKELLANGERITFDFPWRSWNKRVFPLRAGMIGTIYGPTKAGKSIYFDMIAEYWASLGHHVVLVHLEDALDYKLDRRLARHSRIDYNRIVVGNLNEHEEQAKKKANEQMQSMFAHRLHYYHAPGKSMSQICSELTRRRGEGVCDAVVLDYLDKVQPARAQIQLFGDKVWERQAHDMELFKSCMEENKIVGFTGGQGTKEMQDSTELDMKNIAGSGQKLHKAQAVMMFGRKRVGAKGMADDDGNEIAKPGSMSPYIDIGVVAQNQGEAQTWQQVLVGSNFLVKDLPTE